METPNLRGVHVLVVEDNADSRELLAGALRYCGAFVTTAESKKEAARRLDDLWPHAIVSDIAMPDDGIELLRYVMEIMKSRGARIPVVAISADHDHREALQAAGFVEFVPKPLDPIDLCRRIVAHVVASPLRRPADTSG